MKKSKIIDKLVAISEFSGILTAGLPQIASAVNTSSINVCRQSNDSQSYRVTFNYDGETILVIGEKDSGNKLDRGRVGNDLINDYGFSESDAEIVVTGLLPYDVFLNSTSLCSNEQLNVGANVDATSIRVCSQSSNDVFYRITLDHNGETLIVQGEKDNGNKLNREGVKQNLINNYNFNESDAQIVKDVLLPHDIPLTETPLCTTDDIGDREQVSTELVLSVDVSSSVDDREFELQRDGYIAAFRDTDVQQAIKNLPKGLAVTMQFWSEDEVVDIGWFKLIENSAGEIDNLDSFIAAMEDTNVVRDLDGNEITVGSRTAKYGGGTDIALAINSAKNQIALNSYNGESLVIDVSGDGVSDDTPYSGVNEEDGDCPHAHFCPPLETARDAAVADGIVINGLPIVNDQDRSQLTHEIDIHYETLVIGGEGSFVEVANDFAGFATAAKNKIFREITLVPEVPQVFAD